MSILQRCAFCIIIESTVVCSENGHYRGHLEEDYPITMVFENKRFSSFSSFNNIHEFAGSGKFKWFESFQWLHRRTLNFIGQFAKKLENLLSSKNVVMVNLLPSALVRVVPL